MKLVGTDAEFRKGSGPAPSLRLVGTDAAMRPPGRNREEWTARVRGSYPAMTRGDDAARNDINVALSAIYWKFGRTAANEVIDLFELGEYGWEEF